MESLTHTFASSIHFVNKSQSLFNPSDSFVLHLLFYFLLCLLLYSLPLTVCLPFNCHQTPKTSLSTLILATFLQFFYLFHFYACLILTLFLSTTTTTTTTTITTPKSVLLLCTFIDLFDHFGQSIQWNLAAMHFVKLDEKKKIDDTL